MRGTVYAGLTSRSAHWIRVDLRADAGREVIEHEIGHVLGLRHDTLPLSVMTPSVIANCEIRAEHVARVREMFAVYP